MIAVLAACAVLVGVAVAAQNFARRSTLTARAIEHGTHAAAHERSAAFFALAANMEPLISAKRSQFGVALGGAQFRITTQSEDLKPDINHAPLALIEGFLEDTLDGRTLRAVLATIEHSRRQSTGIAEVGALLPHCHRLTDVARRVSERLTVATGIPTVGRFAIGPEEIRRLPGATSAIERLLTWRDGGQTVDTTDPRLSTVAEYLGPSTGLYTTVVEWLGTDIPPGAARFLILRGEGGPTILTSTLLIPPLDGNYCRPLDGPSR